MYEPHKTHVVANIMLRLPNIAKLISVPNQTTYASLFYTKPKWFIDVKEFLRRGQIEGALSI
jgi:hypothetical protein